MTSTLEHTRDAFLRANEGRLSGAQTNISDLQAAMASGDVNAAANAGAKVGASVREVAGMQSAYKSLCMRIEDTLSAHRDSAEADAAEQAKVNARLEAIHQRLLQAESEYGEWLSSREG